MSHSDIDEEHEIVKKITKDNQEVTGISCFKGHIGKSPSPDNIRLYINSARPRFSEYIEIPKGKIVHSRKLSDEEIQFGGGVEICVPSDLSLKWVRTVVRQEEAYKIESSVSEDTVPSNLGTFLEGDLISKYLDESIGSILLMRCGRYRLSRGVLLY